MLFELVLYSNLTIENSRTRLLSTILARYDIRSLSCVQYFARRLVSFKKIIHRKVIFVLQNKQFMHFTISWGNRNVLKNSLYHFLKLSNSSDQLLKILKNSSKVHNFLLIDQSECYMLFVSILIGQCFNKRFKILSN